MSNAYKSMVIILAIALIVSGVIFAIYKKKQVNLEPVIVTPKAKNLTETEKLDILNQLSEKDVIEEAGRVLEAVNKLSKESPSPDLTSEQKQAILDSLAK